MDLVEGYSSDASSTNKEKSLTSLKEEEEEEGYAPATSLMKFKVETAPEIVLKDENIYSSAIVPDELSKKKVGGKAVGQVMKVNVPYKYMPSSEDILPDHPSSKGQKLLMEQGVYGHLDQQAFSDYQFKMQENTFKSYGYAQDPSLNTMNNNGGLGGGIEGSGYVGDHIKALKFDGALTGNKLIKHQLNVKPKRKGKGDSSILDGDDMYMGPWAGYEGENIGEPVGPTEEELKRMELSEDEKEKIEEEESLKRRKKDNLPQKTIETTTFHGSNEFDYLGRTYMHIPQDLDIDLLTEPGKVGCFLPKKVIHTYKGHTKGVSCIRLFPKSGHLILSAGMDGSIKLWDFYHDRELLRSFNGHSKAVREVNFNNNGSQFLSCSYDRYIKLWDTESGKCIRSFTTGKIPYTAKFHPDPNKQHIFLAGLSDKRIVQFDSNTGNIIQEYSQHLGAINSITFVDDNRRFVSTSDDKTLRVWENDIPVVIKYIAEPYMHSMPAVSKHPNGKFIACQSLDNQILIYSAKGRFTQNNKKSFSGHVISGYACQPNFSSDGRFLMSGDADGNLWFWDWKSTKVLKKLKQHDGVVIGCEWHPHETSKVVTCSWDGSIKIWD